MITKIKWTALEGNLGDAAEFASEYVSAVESALEEAFPDATVIVDLVRNTSGKGPACRVESDNDNYAEEQLAVEKIERIAESVWNESSEWMPA